MNGKEKIFEISGLIETAATATGTPLTYRQEEETRYLLKKTSRVLSQRDFLFELDQRFGAGETHLSWSEHGRFIRREISQTTQVVDAAKHTLGRLFDSFKAEEETGALRQFTSAMETQLWGLYAYPLVYQGATVRKSSALIETQAFVLTSFILTENARRIGLQGSYYDQFCVFFGAILRGLSYDSPRRTTSILAILGFLEENLLSSGELADEVQKTTYNRGFTDSLEELNHCRARRDLMPSRQAHFLSSVKLYGPPEESSRSYWDLYCSYHGLNEEQQRASSKELEHTYGIDYRILKPKIDLAERILFDPDSLVVGPALFSHAEKGLTEELIAYIRVLTAKRKKEELAELAEERQWMGSYRSRGVLEFDIFLLSAFTRIAEKYRGRKNLQEIFDLTTYEAGKYLRAKHGYKGSLLPSMTRSRVKILLGITESYKKMSDADRYQEVGRDIEKAICASGLMQAIETANFASISCRGRPTDIVFDSLLAERNRKDSTAKKLGLSPSTLTNLTKTAILDYLLSGALTDQQYGLIFDEARLYGEFTRLDDPRSFHLRPGILGIIERDSSVAQAYRELALEEPGVEDELEIADPEGNLPDKLGRAYLFYKNKIARHKGLRDDLLSCFLDKFQVISRPFENYILRRTAQGWSASDICREILERQGLPQDRNKEFFSDLVVILSETQKVLTYFPKAWGI